MRGQSPRVSLGETDLRGDTRRCRNPNPKRQRGKNGDSRQIKVLDRSDVYRVRLDHDFARPKRRTKPPAFM